MPATENGVFVFRAGWKSFRYKKKRVLCDSPFKRRLHSYQWAQ